MDPASNNKVHFINDPKNLEHGELYRVRYRTYSGIKIFSDAYIALYKGIRAINFYDRNNLHSLTKHDFLLYKNGKLEDYFVYEHQFAFEFEYCKLSDYINSSII